MKKTLLILMLANLIHGFGQNLVLHYSLDDLTAAVGPTGNLIPNGSGTAANVDSLGATLTAGEHCASFFNGGGYISTSPLSNVGWTGTAISFWYKSESTFQGVILQGGYLGFVARMYTNGKIEATFDGSVVGSHSSNTPINDGVWHHVVIQNGGSITEIYIDGVLDNTVAETLYTMPSPHPSAYLYMGSHANDVPSEKIYGKVDEIKVYDNVLSQTQIDALYAYAPCVVNIPDANFKAYLVGNSSINTNSDTEIQCAEAAAFTGTIDCNSLNISDMTGIEAFTGITTLYCYSNQISTIDLSQNTEIITLQIAGNQLTSLNTSQNTALDILYCYGNQLNTLDVSQNTLLTVLLCYSNNLSNLDISNNTLLTQVNFAGNDLTTIDISNNSMIEMLTGNSNLLTSIDVSNNSLLTHLYVGNNNLTSLDVSSNTQLFELCCEYNNLTSLNVKNGNNTNFAFFAANNNNLSCITVDNPTYSTTNWTNIDPGTAFSTDCAIWAGVESNLKNTLKLYPNPAQDNLTIQIEGIVSEVHIFDLSGALVLRDNNNNISVSQLAAGVYTISIKTDKGIVYEKFIKE